jgi:hypothetical protein
MMRLWDSAVVLSRSKAIEAEGHGGGGKVVINGFGNANDGPTEVIQLQTRCKRAIAADDDEGFDVKLVDGLAGAIDDILGDFSDLTSAYLGGEVAFVG